MQAKIEWFKEILELDPSSKVFFPLAKLLAEAGQPHEALELLREGAARHPDFLEARFFFLELCARVGDDDTVAEEAGYLGEILGRYPLFWKAWAQNLARRPETRDAALALDFVSVHFTGAPVSWGEVIQRGLEGLFHNHQTTLPFSGETDTFLHRPKPAEAKQPTTVETRPVHPPVAVEAPPAVAVTMQPEPPLVEEDLTPEPPVDTAELQPAEPAPQPRPADEVFSIRTRTMARLLAEQGDYDGALEIYRELLAKARDDAEREELDAIIERMQLMMRDGPDVAANAEPAPRPVPDEMDASQTAAPLPEEAVLEPAVPEPTAPDHSDLVADTAPALPQAEPMLVAGAGGVASVPIAPAMPLAPVSSPPPSAAAPRPTKRSSRSALERLALRLERRAGR
ncbi:tetratricopeptide repeat protein [Megalodesulfovibrio paquesii]